MTKHKLTKHEDDVRRGIRDPERYDPVARSIGGPWYMKKVKDGAYVCYEQHLEIVENLRKSAEINPAQSPHDGIHTCSKGCSKPGCNRALRDTIEEQNAQIEALKQDLKEEAARSRHVRMKVIHFINMIGGQQEELSALRSQFANSEWQPIETAPKDGTEFIGYSERCSINVVHYGMNDDGEGWLIWAGFCTQLIDVQTHWMPLPKPPKEDKQSV